MQLFMGNDVISDKADHLMDFAMVATTNIKDGSAVEKIKKEFLGV